MKTTIRTSPIEEVGCAKKCTHSSLSLRFRIVASEVDFAGCEGFFLIRFHSLNKSTQCKYVLQGLFRF